MRPFALAASLADAAALADRWGQGTRLAFGRMGDADILVPSGRSFTPALLKEAAGHGHEQYFLTFGNTAAPPHPATLGPMIDLLTRATGTGFMAVCLADPWRGRTVFQGYLFEDTRLLGNMLTAFGEQIDGRVGLVPHHITAAGSIAVRTRLAGLKEQGYALALVDALNPAECTMVAEVFEGQKLIAGAAWLVPETDSPEAAPPTGPLAILSGALDRQSLYQLGAASAVMPLFQLNLADEQAAAAALDWAGGKIGGSPFIISASVPPGRLTAGAPVEAILSSIAAGLIERGVTRMVLAGSDTAAAVLAGLSVETLVAGAAAGPFRWLLDHNCAFLVKPGGAGAKDIFFGQIEPQIRLNAAAE